MVKLDAAVTEPYCIKEQKVMGSYTTMKPERKRHTWGTEPHLRMTEFLNLFLTSFSSQGHLEEVGHLGTSLRLQQGWKFPLECLTTLKATLFHMGWNQWRNSWGTHNTANINTSINMKFANLIEIHNQHNQFQTEKRKTRNPLQVINHARAWVYAFIMPSLHPPPCYHFIRSH